MEMNRRHYATYLSMCVQLFVYGVETKNIPQIRTSIHVEDTSSQEILSDNLYLLVGRTVLRAQYQFTCKLPQSTTAGPEAGVSNYQKQWTLFTIYLVSTCDNTKVDDKAGNTPLSNVIETNKCIRDLFKDEECNNATIPLDYIKLHEWLSTLLWNAQVGNTSDVSIVTVFPPEIFSDQSTVSVTDAGTDLHLIISDPSLYSANGVDWDFSNPNVVFETRGNCRKPCAKDLEPEGRVIYFNGTNLDATSPFITGSYWRCAINVKYYLRNQDVALILKIIQDNHVWTRRLTTLNAWKEDEEPIGEIEGIFKIQLQFYKNQHIPWKIGKLQRAVFENCHLPTEPSEKPVAGPNDGIFVCRSGVTIGAQQLCDFHKDCFHGDDESDELCGKKYSLGLCDFEGKEAIDQCPFILSDYFENTPTLISANTTVTLTDFDGSVEGHILAYEEKFSAKKTGFVIVNLTNHVNYLSDNQSCQFQLDVYLRASVGRFRVRIIDSETENALETYDKRLTKNRWQIYQLGIPDFSERNVTSFYMEVFVVLSKGEFLGFDNIYISPDCILHEPEEKSTRVFAEEKEDNVFLVVILTTASVAFVWITVLLLLYRRYIKIMKSGEAGKRIFGGRARSLKGLPDSAPLLRRLNDNLCQDHPNFLMYKEILTQDLNDDIKNLSRYKLKLTNVLGSGAFGEVLQGQLIKGAFLKHVAVKRLSRGCSEKERTDFLVEALTMSKFKHDNIVSCLGIYVKNGSLLLVEELMAGGDLKRFLVESRPTLDETPALSIDELLSLANDICQACSYLEINKFIHRDIASRNCLLTTKTSDRVAKMADFGLARDIIQNDSYKKCGRSMLPVRWLPPESFLEGLFTTKSDVWAYGILLWEIFSFGHDPYPGMKCEEMMAKVNVGNRMEAPPRCPKAIYDVMMLCWQHDPKSRPSFQRLCEYIHKIRKNEYISIGSCANISDDENDRENSDDYDNKHPIWKCNGNYAIEEDSV